MIFVTARLVGEFPIPGRIALLSAIGMCVLAEQCSALRFAWLRNS